MIAGSAAAALAAARALIVAHAPDCREDLERRNWLRVLAAVKTDQRLKLARLLRPALTAEERPRVILRATRDDVAPRGERRFLIRALHQIRRAGMRGFDGPRAPAAYAALPDVVRAYRGTVFLEWQSLEWGVCWTVSVDVARGFAEKHGKGRTGHGGATVLEVEVRKALIAGVITGGRATELLLLPEELAPGRVRFGTDDA